MYVCVCVCVCVCLSICLSACLSLSLRLSELAVCTCVCVRVHQFVFLWCLRVCLTARVVCCDRFCFVCCVCPCVCVCVCVCVLPPLTGEHEEEDGDVLKAAEGQLEAGAVERHDDGGDEARGDEPADEGETHGGLHRLKPI